MRDTELYERILDLREPWKVEVVKLETEKKLVEVRVGYRPETLWGNREGERLVTYDHVERQWRHLDTCGFETIIVCRVPRVRGPDGKVEIVAVPWAGRGSRFTLLFERFVIDVLLACRSVSAAGGLLSLSWDQVHRIMERAVERGMDRRELEGLRYVGLDEKSFLKGQSYVSLLTDLDASRVLEVMEGNDREAAEMLFATLPEEVLAGLKAVCTDMSGHFGACARESLPEADLVHDRYHISAHLNQAVAKVHREENRRLQELGDERLKGTQRLFGYDPDHLNEEQALRFAEVKNSELKSARAWSIKELFRHFWNYRYEANARKFFKKWFGWASRSQLKPMIKVAKMLKAHFENIITYLRHPITNAVTEGLNSKIQAIKSNARGFRSFFNYRTRILFFCGKLNLYPL
jgi:transposase